ncbi:hypothetical protein BC829DRAFT_429165 [Chytridium lagenaria]|nr:hypothetical protein BC829DRAFT_429165 [Chytridium lagenaria]
MCLSRHPHERHVSGLAGSLFQSPTNRKPPLRYVYGATPNHMFLDDATAPVLDIGDTSGNVSDTDSSTTPHLTPSSPIPIDIPPHLRRIRSELAVTFSPETSTSLVEAEGLSTSAPEKREWLHPRMRVAKGVVLRRRSSLGSEDGICYGKLVVLGYQASVTAVGGDGDQDPDKIQTLREGGNHTFLLHRRPHPNGYTLTPPDPLSSFMFKLKVNPDDSPIISLVQKPLNSSPEPAPSPLRMRSFESVRRDNPFAADEEGVKPVCVGVKSPHQIGKYLVHWLKPSTTTDVYQVGREPGPGVDMVVPGASYIHPTSTPHPTPYATPPTSPHSHPTLLTSTRFSAVMISVSSMTKDALMRLLGIPCWCGDERWGGWR